jgi:hypothetical protein
MGIARNNYWISLAFIALVTGCATSQPTPSQLDQLTRRTSALEQEVRELETANAQLRKQVRELQPWPGQGLPRELHPPLQPGLPLEPFQPPGPRVNPPPTNGQPHLTPLEQNKN